MFKIKYVLFTLVVLFSTFSCQPSAASPLPISGWVNETSKAVVIYAVNERGHGVVGSAIPVTEDLLLSAGHVCDSIVKERKLGRVDGSVTAKYIDGNTIKEMKGFEVLKYKFNESVDLCVLYKENHGLPIATIAYNYNQQVKFGDRVYVIGAPLGLFPLLTEGLVSAPKASDLPSWFNNKLLISSPVEHGNSGGPVFNEKGFVIGILVMSHPNYHHISFAMTSEEIWKFLMEIDR